MAVSAISGRRIRLSNPLRFGVVGLSGLVINQLLLAGLTEVGGIHYALSAVLATQGSTTWNFFGTDVWAFGDRTRLRGRSSRFLAFLAINNATLLLRIPALWLLTETVGINYLVANVLTLAALFIGRFALADRWIWSEAAPERAEASGRPVVARALVPPQEFRYDIAGILRLDSDVELRELAYFISAATTPPDIRITNKRVGSVPIRRVRFDRDGDRLSYFEHLGAASANFRLTMGDPIQIEVAPLLARSPHVLYTNVVEALLRFLLVSRGYVLLHSACISVNGRAALLSAQTDTGKTSTVIKLVRDLGYQFLSDDMTIIDPAGRAICYPKPMTLSYHTMSSIRGGELSKRQRAKLAVQSRLHSKSGRSVGSAMGTWNIPIMSVNSVVQMLIPPPKYHIGSLMPCEIRAEAPIGHVFLLERGPSTVTTLTPEMAVGPLIENTDDAYGFPPFATFAPHIRIGGEDYQSLRAKEERLLQRAISSASIWRVSVPGHEWAEVLPALIEGRGVDPGAFSIGESPIIESPIISVAVNETGR